METCLDSKSVECFENKCRKDTTRLKIVDFAAAAVGLVVDLGVGVVVAADAAAGFVVVECLGVVAGGGVDDFGGRLEV